jgi:hypothetical protein
MMKLAIPAFAFLSLLAPDLSAQSAQALSFQMTARIEKLSKAPIFAPKATHRARCTDVYLRAGKGVNLSLWEGKYVNLVGSPKLALAVMLEVTKIESSKYYLEISQRSGGAFRLGEEVTFSTRTPWIAISPWVMSGKPAFIPAQDYGALTLSPLSLIYIRNDIPFFGRVRTRVKIPMDRSLIGISIYQQGMYLSIGLSQVVTGRLLNNDCFKIQAPSGGK